MNFTKRAKGNSVKTYTCDCCGTGFRDTAENQRKHDKDMGCGLCPKCKKVAYEANEVEWKGVRGEVAGAMNPKNSANM